MKYNLVSMNDTANITVFVDGEMYVASSDHPNFDAIVAAVVTGDEGVVDLFDVSRTIATRFEGLSERVSVAGGHVFFDGDEVHNSLTNQIVRFLDDGVDDWMPLVEFFERVQTNPQEHSRENLYRWIEREDLTITPDGMIVGYKAVTGEGTDESPYRSIHAGREDVTVDEVVHKGQIPNPLGAVVSMPRSVVAHDPDAGCSVGLHVGTFGFANGFGGSGTTLLKVLVDPRDVVSVPNEDAGKMRVCRYFVDSVARDKVVGPVYDATVYGPHGYDPSVDDEEEVTLCSDCGDEINDGEYLCEECEDQQYNYGGY